MLRARYAEPSHVRIIQIAESWGGMEHNNSQLAARLVRLGHKVSITTVGLPAYSQMPARYRQGVELEEISWALERPPTFRQWTQLMRERPADLAVLPKNWWAKGGLSLVWAAGLVYSRVVLREHVAVPAGVAIQPPQKRFLGLPLPRFWWYKHLAYGMLLSTCPKKIICVSRTVRDRLVEYCAFPPKKTVVVHNGVDTRLFRRDPAERSLMRSALNIPESSLVLGAVGRLDNGTKRHDWSLRAFARLIESRPDLDLRFLLVGEGEDRQALVSLAENLGVSQRVTLAPFTSKPWEAYNALDVFLMPSAFEAFGLSLVEAMACERCVIASGVDGINEVLSEPGIGLRIAPDDEPGLLQAMKEVVDMSNAERSRMGERARASVVLRFDADQQYEKIIGHLLGNLAQANSSGSQDSVGLR